MEKKMIGLLGSHRIGKTTLARSFCAGNQMYDFMPTTTSQVFKDLGFNPKQKLDITQRIFVQEEVLRRADEMYSEMDGYAVLDRTPLDYAMYMLSECLPSGLDEQSSNAVLDYVQKCFDVTNRHFSTIVLVQPGIDAPDEEGKAKIVPAYQEHLNSIALGLLMDERVSIFKAVIPRDVLSLDERTGSLESIVKRIRQQNNRTMIDVTLQ